MAPRSQAGNSRLKFAATIFLCVLIVVQIPTLYRSATDRILSGGTKRMSSADTAQGKGECGEDRFNCAHDATPEPTRAPVQEHHDAGVEVEEGWTTIAPPTSSPLGPAGDEVPLESDGSANVAGGVEKGSLFGNAFPPMKQSETPCLGSQYKQGEWVFNPDKVPKYESRGEILGCCQHGADKKKAEEKRAGGNTTTPKYRPETQYEWQPESCRLLPWSEEDFCKSLRGRDIMLAGDSLNDHWHASLFYLLGGKGDIYRKEGTIRGKHRCHGHAICGKYYPKPLKLFFLTNQLLTDHSRPGRNYKWHKTINEYPILILNSGSWMRDPENEEREVSDTEWEKHQRTALRLVKEVKKYNGTVIWRTAYQGHPYCWKYTEPLKEELKDSDFPNVAPYKRYRWFAIPKRNDYAVKLWRKEGAEILDVKRITNLMPLGHLGQNHPKFGLKNTTDCLHYCSPGPSYDTWSMLLMNLLLGNLGE